MKIILLSTGLKAVNAPEKPRYPSANADMASGGKAWIRYEEAMKAYTQALSKAIEESVPFKDSGEMWKIMYSLNMFSGQTHSEQQGKLYDIPIGWQVKVITTCKWSGNKDACANETCWDLDECQKNPEAKYAVLEPLTKQEPEAWTEGFPPPVTQFPKPKSGDDNPVTEKPTDFISANALKCANRRICTMNDFKDCPCVNQPVIEQKEETLQSELTIIDGKVNRRYTETWRKSGNVDIDRIPDWVTAIVSQQKFMVAYIEKLHDKIDELLEPQSKLLTPDTLPMDFVLWYSGMSKQQILNAYERFKNETHG